jgi:hypothetical protein
MHGIWKIYKIHHISKPIYKKVNKIDIYTFYNKILNE